ncbi:ATP-dependent RNA helicase abstrakt [Trichinella spiralis]|uniref:ATP-dependent RNA helicase abstrakt n=1 Tax=Trichinella spiralis TaxID=6334 RepID=UPI0001EFC452|nr:ATP-dependent RNA helicase abstrakt [Trichinella spiralis]
MEGYIVVLNEVYFVYKFIVLDAQVGITRKAEQQHISVLLDLKHLLLEAKQEVPLFLSSFEAESEKLLEIGDERGCTFCGGLGHRISDCPKLESLQNKRAQSLNKRDFLAYNTADW